MFDRTRLAGLLILALAAPLSAQKVPVGSATYAVHIRRSAIPASVQTPMPIDAIPTVMIQLAANGETMAASFTISDSGSAPGLAMLSTGWVRAMLRPTHDSIDVAVSVPEMFRALLAPAAGDTAPPGYRFAVAIPHGDSIHAGDSTGHVSSVATGRHRTFAGVACEEWQLLSRTDTLNVCMADSSRVLGGLPSWRTLGAHLSESARRAGVAELFGGRPVVPIAVAANDSSFDIQLVNASSEPPPPEFFAIPASFKWFDPKSINLPTSIIKHLP